MPEEYYELLLKLAKKAACKDEVPVSAILVKNNKVLAKAYNTRISHHSVCDHAEMLVIKKASRKLHDWRLEDCDVYVTLKPCNMCEAALKQARIKNVYYILDKLPFKKEYNQTNIKQTYVREQQEEYLHYFQAFFQKKRDKMK